MPSWIDGHAPGYIDTIHFNVNVGEREWDDQIIFSTSGSPITYIPREEEWLVRNGYQYTVKQVVWDWDRNRVVIHLAS